MSVVISSSASQRAATISAARSKAVMGDLGPRLADREICVGTGGRGVCVVKGASRRRCRG